MKTQSKIIASSLRAASVVLSTSLVAFLMAAGNSILTPPQCPLDSNDTCYDPGKCGSYSPGTPFSCCMTIGTPPNTACCTCRCTQVFCAPVEPQFTCLGTGIIRDRCFNDGTACVQAPTYQYCQE
jgi:hypothetical protein